MCEPANPNMPRGVKNAATLAFAFLCFCIAIALIGVGGRAYSTSSSVHFGSWWSGTFAVIPIVMMLFTGCDRNNQPLRILSFVFGVIAVLLCGAGLIVDGIGYAIFKVVNECVPMNDNDQILNFLIPVDRALTCCEQFPLCSPIVDTNRCLCCDFLGNSNTAAIQLNDVSDCRFLVDQYPHLLAAGFALNIILGVLLIISMITLCCGGRQQQQIQPTMVVAAPAVAISPAQNMNYK